MKELLVVLGLTLLGCVLAALILGGDGTLLGATKSLMEGQIGYLAD